MALTPEVFVEQVRKLVRLLRYGSRELPLAAAGILLLGGARWVQALKNLPPKLPASAMPWIVVSLGLVGGLCLLLATWKIWRKVVAPLPESGGAKLPALKGASSFGPQDAELFARLGRTAELGRLRDWILDDQKPLVVLMGESGVGKTSLLRAGLAHALASDAIPVIYWEAQPTDSETGLLH